MRNVKLIIFLLCCCSAVKAQEQSGYIEDAQVRAHFNLEKSFGDRFSVHLDQQYRFVNNVSTFQRANYDLGFTFKITKNIRLIADYRYMLRKGGRGFWGQRNWYTGGLVFRKNLGYWRIVGRAIVQARNGNTNSDSEFLTKWYNRDKISIRYEINKRLTGFVAQEIYIPLNNPQYMGIDRFRSIAGIIINTFKNQQLELHFMYQQWLQRGGWWDANDNARDRMLRKTYILGIGYGIEL